MLLSGSLLGNVTISMLRTRKYFGQIGECTYTSHILADFRMILVNSPTNLFTGFFNTELIKYGN